MDLGRAVCDDAEGALALAMHLPVESRTARLNHPELEWREGDYILALIYDQLAGMAYGMGGRKGKKPKPLPRPKAEKKKKERKYAKPKGVGAKRVDELLFAPRSDGRKG